jgi:hypothetical protein
MGRLGPCVGRTVLAGLMAAVLAATPSGVRHGAVQAQAVCDYQILPLAQLVQQTPVIVLADAIRERTADGASFITTLRVLSALKGSTSTPDISIGDLGHLDLDCQGGPRLLRGNRYMLFLTRSGADPAVVWSLSDFDGSVFQITNAGVRFPPERPGSTPQLLPVAPGEFMRDVGVSLLGDDPARIESLIADNGLVETIERPPVAPPQKPWYQRLDRQNTAIAVAGGCVMLASLLFLLWRPKAPDPYRRP